MFPASSRRLSQTGSSAHGSRSEVVTFSTLNAHLAPPVLILFVYDAALQGSQLQIHIRSSVQKNGCLVK